MTSFLGISVGEMRDLQNKGISALEADIQAFGTESDREAGTTHPRARWLEPQAV